MGSLTGTTERITWTGGVKPLAIATFKQQHQQWKRPHLCRSSVAVESCAETRLDAAWAQAPALDSGRLVHPSCRGGRDVHLAAGASLWPLGRRPGAIFARSWLGRTAIVQDRSGASWAIRGQPVC